MRRLKLLEMQDVDRRVSRFTREASAKPFVKFTSGAQRKCRAFVGRAN